jgi:hypothetical protein
VISSKDTLSWEGNQRAISLLPEKLSSIQNGQDRIGFKLELEEIVHKMLIEASNNISSRF